MGKKKWTGPRRKFRNTRTVVFPDGTSADHAPGVVGGILFDSRREAKRWLELLDRLRKGEISYLHRQVAFRILLNGVLVCKYIADFVYIEAGMRVVEDVKSEMTKKLPVYRLKKKMLHAAYGITIRET